MKTKLSEFCDRILEAGWLSALIVAPLFFNIYSDRVFEPDKLTLVRSLALVMAAVWLTKALAGAFSGDKPANRPALWERIRSTPLMPPTLLMVLAYILSTALSVAPHISLWGSYQRLQGAYSTFSYIVIFFMVLSTLRRREQLDRLINTIILTSLPIAIYGILQHYGRDPLPWGGDTRTRVASNMGNAIFVAAYLIMAFFLTVERLARSFIVLFDEKRGDIAHAILAGCYGAILGLQVLCIIFTQSRGPWLGWFAGLYMFVLLGLISLRRRGGFLGWAWKGWVGLTLAGAIFLGVLNVPNSPLAPLREVPYLGRLGQMLELESGTGRVRVLIWEGVVDLLGRDAGRTLIGYGPEAMWMAYNRVYPPDLAHYEARNASPDRSHNETFDSLVMTGAIGFLIYIFLFSSVFYYGLKWLGLIRNARERLWFILIGVAGAALGVVIPSALDGNLRLAGVGLPAGFIIAILLFYVPLAGLLKADGVTDEKPLGRKLLLITLFSTIVAHFVEIHFGIAIASTRVHFWALAAVLVVVGMDWVQVGSAAPAPAAPVENRPAKKGKREAPAVAASSHSPLALTFAFALVAALILIVCSYDYITNQAGDRTVINILGRALTTLVKGANNFETSFGILGLFVLTWLVGGLLTVSTALAGARQPEEQGKWPLYAVAYAGVTLMLVVPFMFVHAGRLVPYAADPTNHVIVPYVTMFLVMAMLAGALYAETRPLPARAWGDNGWLFAGLGVGLLAAALGISVATNLSIIRADTFYKQGKTSENYQRYDASINFYQQAINLAPDQDFYYLFLGRVILEKAQTISDATQRDAQITRSRDTLIRAQKMNPLNTDHTANLGRLHRIWAQNATDEARRTELFKASLDYYAQALQLSPRNAGLYNEWGLVYYLMARYDDAMAKYDQSLALDQAFDQTYLLRGDIYLARQDYETAAASYQKAAELAQDSSQAHSALGYTYAQMGRLDDAINENLIVLRSTPDDYVTLRNLALLYQQSGRATDALKTAQLALPKAPDRERVPLQQMIEQLKAQVGQAPAAQPTPAPTATK
jgi:tetratricopeptide (TPR) repeat protein/O-antigen ligase